MPLPDIPGYRAGEEEAQSFMNTHPTQSFAHSGLEAVSAAWAPSKAWSEEGETGVNLWERSWPRKRAQVWGDLAHRAQAQVVPAAQVPLRRFFITL